MALPGLRRERIRRELTVRGLAEKAGVDPSTISLVENGRRGAQEITIRKIARALETDVELLRRDRGAGGGVAGDAADNLGALARLWAKREGITEDEAVRRIRMEQEKLGRHDLGGGRRLGLPQGERIVAASGRKDAASSAVSAVRGE